MTVIFLTYILVISFILAGGCCCSLRKGINQAAFQLEDNEEIKIVAKGDYYERSSFLLKSYLQGGFAFTNKRILFKSYNNKFISIPYSEISLIKKSYILGYIPLAFFVNTVYGQTYEFAIWERDQCIDIIYENIKQQ